MNSVFTAKLAKLFLFKLVGGLLFVLGRSVIFPLALSAIQTNDDTHGTTSLSVALSGAHGFDGKTHRSQFQTGREF